MRELVFKKLEEVKTNNKNYICFFRNNVKYQKTFKEFASDVEDCIARLTHLKKTYEAGRIAIIGPTSYDWSVIDIACIKGGFLSIAIPETLPESIVKDILTDTHADVLLLDYRLRDKYNLPGFPSYYFECDPDHSLSFFGLQVNETPKTDADLILEQYSIVFSSGTSEKIKQIKRTFPTLEKKSESWLDKIKQVPLLIKYKRSFWARSNNKVIIFMPFSHAQQRDFFRMALFRKINIVLSDQKNCIRHIILEKPNIMVSVPVIYEAMAARIKTKVECFSNTRRALYYVFNTLRINNFPNGSYIKQLFSLFLFKEIKKIYGGRADYFVTGSAPISPEVIKIFHKVGVKLLQAYGQSETGNIAMNTPEKFKIGSVGKPIMEMKISEDSEILVKYDETWHPANRDILTIDNQEYIHTGDLGYLDKDGFLFVTGRIDDIIVLENGKKIFPEKIEARFKSFEQVKDACILVKDGYKLQLVVDYIGKPKPNEIPGLIRRVNMELPDYERIAAYHIADNIFSEENGLLTSTLKKKRTSIRNYFSDKEFIAV